MAKLIDWIRTASTRILDPEREERIAKLAETLRKELIAAGAAFDLEQATRKLDVAPRDVSLVAEQVFEYALRHAWRDRKITTKEQVGLRSVAQRLRIDDLRAAEIQQAMGRRVFEACLAHAISDGVLTSAELKSLEGVSAGVGISVRNLVIQYFSREGEGFLRGVFASMTHEGTIDEEQWASLLRAADGLGFTEGELQNLIRPQAERFVEHVLADAKADEYLDDKEIATLRWLLGKLELTPPFRTYVEEEVRELQVITNIKQGRLPSIEARGVTLRAGEIVHMQVGAGYYHTRHLKSGPRTDTHYGVATITDSRFIFSSETKSLEMNHHKIIDIIPLSGTIQIRTGGRGAGNYDFGPNNAMAALIYESAVAKANQTLVEKRKTAPRRHIPRDVRQRVWQKYGGVCADCGANQYLEFDHIVPVAKGGGSSEANIQLLCRACNLKKSDHV
jgi:hypothetical protein